MGNIIIALLLILSLIIQKAESNIDNKEILLKIKEYHLKIKNQMQSIVDETYTKTRKKITKWIIFLFITLAILNYLSTSIFGVNSVNTLLNDKRILVFTCFLVVLIIGRLDKADLFKIIFVSILSGLFLIYIVHSNNFAFKNYNFLKDLPINIYFKDFLIVLSILLMITFILLIISIARIISYLLYLVIKYTFKFCIYLSPQRPLKFFVFIYDLSFIFTLSILSVI